MHAHKTARKFLMLSVQLSVFMYIKWILITTQNPYNYLYIATGISQYLQ